MWGAKTRIYGENRGTQSASATASRPSGAWFLSRAPLVSTSLGAFASWVDGRACRGAIDEPRRQSRAKVGPRPTRDQQGHRYLESSPVDLETESCAPGRPDVEEGRLPSEAPPVAASRSYPAGLPNTKHRVLEARRAVEPDQSGGFGSGPPALGEACLEPERDPGSPRNPRGQW